MKRRVRLETSFVKSDPGGRTVLRDNAPAYRQRFRREQLSMASHLVRRRPTTPGPSLDRFRRVHVL